MSNIIIPSRHQAAPRGVSGSSVKSIGGDVCVASATMTTNERVQAKNAMAMLLKHYPGYYWSVTINAGVMTVTNMNLSGKWGFVIHLSKLSGDYRELVNAGGELLERYRVHRGKMKRDELAELQRDFRQNFICDKG